MTDNNYLVTGASGFIGRALCEKLQNNGVVVKALLRRNETGPWHSSILYDLNELAVRKSKQLDLTGISKVFHLAGIAHTQNIPKALYWQTNVEATKKLLEISLESGVKCFIYFSSVKAQDLNDEYGRSKKAAEEVVIEYGKKHNIHVCILRPALVYGPGVKGNLLSMMRAIDKGWFPSLPETYNKRSMISLQEVVEIAHLVSETIQSNGKIYTLTDGKLYSSKMIYDGMRQALGLRKSYYVTPVWMLNLMGRCGDVLQKNLKIKMPIHSDMIEKLLGNAEYSSTGIQNELGWQPKISLFDALPSMVKAYRALNV